MHCPKCGHEQVSDEIRFCSGCGFTLYGVSLLLANGGHLPNTGTEGSNRISPKRRGVMQGLFIFLLSFLIVPLIAIISIASNSEPIAVFVALFLLVVGGMLRAAYALMFQEGSFRTTEQPSALAFQPNVSHKELNAPPARAYTSPTTGRWRDTNELTPEPGSVTDSTTKLLERDQ